jgi:Holliday junction resolvase RusA-like endonuclease
MSRPPVPFVTLQFAAPPSVNASTRNVPGKGRVRTKDYSDWLKEAGWQLNMQKPGHVAGKYHLTMKVRRASLRRDLDGYLKLVLDLLVNMGVTDDDRHCESINLSWTDEGEGVHVMVVSAQQGSEVA